MGLTVCLDSWNPGQSLIGHPGGSDQRTCIPLALLVWRNEGRFPLAICWVEVLPNTCLCACDRQVALGKFGFPRCSGSVGPGADGITATGQITSKF